MPLFLHLLLEDASPLQNAFSSFGMCEPTNDKKVILTEGVEQVRRTKQGIKWSLFSANLQRVMETEYRSPTSALTHV